MPVAAIPGNQRLRAVQLGKETTFGTAVAATRRFPWSMSDAGVNPNWTQPTADTGTLDYAIPPYRLRSDQNPSMTGILAYNDAPYLWAALTKSGVTASSSVYTFTPASTSQDSFEIFTLEWGDETADQYQLASGTLNHLALVYPEDLGPVQITADWMYSSFKYPNAMQALSVDKAPTWVYAADTSIYIDSTSGGIGGTVLANTAHGVTVDINNGLDRKSFLQGSNTRFQSQGFGRGLRVTTITLNMAKTTQALAEVANWLNASPVERFLAIDTVAPDIVTGVVHYAHKVRLSGFWTTNSAGTYGTTNTTNQLVCTGWFDPAIYPYQAIVTCGLSAL